MNKDTSDIASIERPKQPKSLLFNYISMLAGTLSSKMLAMLGFVMLSRFLGVEDFGRYSLVFSFWALLNTLMDLGTSALLGRDIAEEPSKTTDTIESAIYIRVGGFLLFALPAYFIGRYLDMSPELIIITFYGLLVGFEVYYDCFFSATMRLDMAAKTRYFSSIVHVCLIALGVLFKLDFLILVTIALSQPLFKLIFDYFLYKPFKISLHAPNFSRIKTMLTDSWALWLVGLLYIVLARIDTLMLVKLSTDGEYQLGLYSAAYRYSEMLALFIASICPSILPLLVEAKNTNDNGERIRYLSSNGTRFFTAVLIIISMCIFWYAQWIILIFNGQAYIEGAQSLQILIWSQTLVAVNTLSYQILMVYNKQGSRDFLSACVSMVILNIGLNFWLIPDFGSIGASWATVATEITMLIVMLYFIKKYTPNRLTKDVLIISVLGGIAMVPPILMGSSMWGILSPLVFIGLIVVSKTLTPTTIKQLVNQKLNQT